MSDTENEVVVEQEVNEVDTLRQQLADAHKAIEALASKKDELLKETKAAKEEKRRIAESSRQEQEALSHKNGEYEKLFKQRDEEYKQLQQQIQQEKQERRQDKINLTANKLAVELAKGDANKAELLSVFVANNLSTLADEHGQLDTSTLDGIKKQFESDAKYKPLLGGNMATGGSAPGNTRSVGDTQKMNRAEFDTMPVHKQAEYISKVRQGKAQLID